MDIKPKVRGFICASAHPTGCHQMVADMVNKVQRSGTFDGPKRVLVIGASTGYGLSSRITAAFGAQASTIGVFYERPPAEKRTASAGWYNSAAFEKIAHQSGLYAKSINGDAFSHDLKKQVVELIQKDWDGQVDLLIYSLASPRRVDPDSGEVYQSCLKSTDKLYQSKSVDPIRGVFKEVEIEPASEEDIKNTIAVMGGDDWRLWIEALNDAKVLASGFQTLAYSYIGPKLTYPIYYHGSIGRAKADMLAKVDGIRSILAPINGDAWVSVNKAVVTQASAAIPVVPLYISVLFEKMQAKGLHEDCIEQMIRLFKDRLYSGAPVEVDDRGRIRIDDWEMQEDIQAEVAACWEELDAENLNEKVDLRLFQKAFYQLFGFEVEGVDYTQDTNPMVMIPSIDI